MTGMWGREQDQDGRLGWDRGRDWGDSGRCSGHGRTEQGRLILFHTPTPRSVIVGLRDPWRGSASFLPSLEIYLQSFRFCLFCRIIYSVE